MSLGLTMMNIKNGDGMKRFSTGMMMTTTMIMIIIEGKKGGDIKRGTGMIPSIMGSTI